MSRPQRAGCNQPPAYAAVTRLTAQTIGNGTSAHSLWTHFETTDATVFATGLNVTTPHNASGDPFLLILKRGLVSVYSETVWEAAAFGHYSALDGFPTIPLTARVYPGDSTALASLPGSGSAWLADLFLARCEPPGSVSVLNFNNDAAPRDVQKAYLVCLWWPADTDLSTVY